MYKKSIILLLFVVLFWISCATPIGSIVKKPEKYDQKKVTVKGVVISSIHLEDLDIFTVKDYSGKIEVITKGYLPVLDDYIVVKGRVKKNFKYGKNRLTVIEEKINIRDRKYKKKIKYKYIDNKIFDSKTFASP